MEYMLGKLPACTSVTLPVILLTLSGTSSHAQSIVTPAETLVSERSLLAERFAVEKLWWWQRRLRLQDWDVAVVVSRASELKPNTLGNIRWDYDKKTAVLHVLNPADYRMRFDAMLRDIEYTVVHELIHLEIAPVLSDLHRTDANRMEEEHAVNHMAEALLKLERDQ
jgi:hypothetical protein